MPNNTESKSILLPLTEDQKRSIDSAELIRDGYYKCFSDRREFEWKMSFSIWTLTSIYLSALVIGKEPITVPPLALTCATMIGSLVLLVLHALWLFGTSIANKRDKRQSFEAADAIRRAIGLDWTEGLSKDIASARDANEQTDGWFFQRARRSLERCWSQLCQLSVTLLLVSLASAAAYARLDPPNPFVEGMSCAKAQAALYVERWASLTYLAAHVSQ